MQTDVVRALGIVVTVGCVRCSRHAEVCPLSLQHQILINEMGERVPKIEFVMICRTTEKQVQQLIKEWTRQKIPQ